MHRNLALSQLPQIVDVSVGRWASATAPPELGYRYRFGPVELPAIRACVEEHGFAIASAVIDMQMVAELREDCRTVMDPVGQAPAGQTRTMHGFIEHSPATEALLQHEALLSIHRHLLGVDEASGMTLHRTSGYYKSPGSGPLTWHLDYNGWEPLHDSMHAGEFLNRGDEPNGAYFYLNGSHPARGGLAVIADSHRPDWEGPVGFEMSPAKGEPGSFSKYRGSFRPRGSSGGAYNMFDVPGCVPIWSEPNDLILFACHTYHAAFPTPNDWPDVRHSVGLRFRRSPELPLGPAPWPLSAEAQALVARAPPSVAPLLCGYTGIDFRWNAWSQGGVDDTVAAPKL
jgi:ectoine hydroxylase-related dioxygenase (phytanoyl-CoA dioxygenase family)